MYSVDALFGKGYTKSPALLRCDMIVLVALQTIFWGQANAGRDNDNVVVPTSRL